MKKILITGASGFVGGHLAEHLLTLSDHEIHGTYLMDESLHESPVKDKIHFVKADLQDNKQVVSLIQQIKPDWIFHLAAQASAGASFTDPVNTFHANIDPEIYLFEALRNENLLQTRVFIASSSEVYGYITPEELPLDELTPLRPANPYAVSKIAQDYLGLQYNLSYNLPVIRVRPFNHIGPRQREGFVVADFAKQIAKIEKGKSEPILTVGNLDAKRDFTDVRDIVKAYPQILEKGQPGEVYNIGSGTSYKIQEVLNLLLSFSNVAITVTVDQAKLRPSDIPEVLCDNKKLMSLINWQPEIPFEQTLKDILDYWRSIE
jgi:GDP-4-dehydro-6-deoxy-D-mannose reductase